MNLKYYLLLLSFFCYQLQAEIYTPNDTLTYKQTEQGDLNLHLFYPEGHKAGINRPVVIFFFGGGWAGGTPAQFYQQCAYYASHGIVAISADYRVIKKHKTTPFQCVEDGKSAIRWVRANANKLGIDPNKIIAGGGSAGGHVAACTALIEGYEVGDTSISSKPNALVLFNPVLDTTKKGYGAEKVKGKETVISPNHHIKKNLPPCIVFHGTADRTVPFSNATDFVSQMKEAGNNCKLIPIKGVEHGFFNGSFFRPSNGDTHFNLTMRESIRFLSEHLLDKPNFDAILSSDAYHIHRGKLSNCITKFKTEKKGTVAFLGGSITYNPGWRNMVCAYLKRKFPETAFTFISAGIPSEGSTSGTFRMQRDILSKGSIDLLFEEAAVNDRSEALRSDSKARQRAMEGIVRQAYVSNPKMDMVLFYFVDPNKISDYNKGITPEEITDHEKVATHYNLSSINLAKEVTDRINANEFTWKEDFKNLHPSPFGQTIYYRSMACFLDKAIIQSDHSVAVHTLPAKMDQFCYDKPSYVAIEKAQYTKGWYIDPTWKPIGKEIVRQGFTEVPYLISKGKGELIFPFKGRAIGIQVLSGADAGIIDYQIDGEAWKTYDLFTPNSPYQHLPRYFMLETSLEKSKEHLLKIRMHKQANIKSKGNVCRIYSFLVNE
jgi:sialidase-1